MQSKITQYGFDFGSMKVTRTHSDKLASVITISTPKNKISIRATKTGNLRFYNTDGHECQLIIKE